MNSRHPSPLRVWKVGSGAHLLPPLHRDPRDSRDPRENSETFIFECPSITFGQKVGKAPPRIGSGTLWRSRGPLGQLWEVLEELWEAPGGMFKTKILFLRKIKAPVGTLNTKAECLGKIKSPCGSAKYTDGVFEENKSPCGHVGDMFRV